MTNRLSAPNTPADDELIRILGDPDGKSFVMKAGAGSGKTTSLVKALAEIERSHGADLLREKQQVACITYTELAAAEIFSDVGESPLFHVSTIHSFLWSVLKPFQRDIKEWVKEEIERKIEKAEKSLAGARKDSTRERYQRRLDRALEDRNRVDQVSRFTYQATSVYRDGLLGHSDVLAATPHIMAEKPLLAEITAQRFPFILVDESQDTTREVIDALKLIARSAPSSFCIGFFGDPVQMIYPGGVGEVLPESTWAEVTKPENFRCPTSVLEVVNRIRKDADGLKQLRGRHVEVDGKLEPVQGSADLFILPADDNRTQNLTRVRQWLAKKYGDDRWTSAEVSADELKILVIEHRIAANRLGFPQLFDAFSQAPSGLTLDFREGNSWPLKVFQEYLIPLGFARQSNAEQHVIRLVRKHAADFLLKRLADNNAGKALDALSASIDQLATLMSPESEASVRDVLLLVRDQEIGLIDDRLLDVLHITRGHDDVEQGDDEDDDSKETKALLGFLSSPIREVHAYVRYISGDSIYATHQGVKGAEFARVLVLIDDLESNHRSFSYDKLLGLAPLSPTDRKNVTSGTDSVLDRTRRLFYVCCSRATSALAVILFAEDPIQAERELREAGPFPSASVHTAADVSSGEAA